MKAARECLIPSYERLGLLRSFSVGWSSAGIGRKRGERHWAGRQVSHGGLRYLPAITSLSDASFVVFWAGALSSGF